MAPQSTEGYIANKVSVASLSGALISSIASAVLGGNTDIKEILTHFVSVGGPTLAAGLAVNFLVDPYHVKSNQMKYAIRGGIGGLLAVQIMMLAGEVDSGFDMATVTLAAVCGAGILVGDEIAGWAYPTDSDN